MEPELNRSVSERMSKRAEKLGIGQTAGFSHVDERQFACQQYLTGARQTMVHNFGPYAMAACQLEAPVEGERAQVKIIENLIFKGNFCDAEIT